MQIILLISIVQYHLYKSASFNLYPFPYYKHVSIHLFDTQHNGYDLSEFCDYFTNNWLESGFHHDIWKHSDHDNEKTNNNSERYNLRFNTYCSIHPNIWKFVIVLKSEESCVAMDYRRINNDSYHPPRKNTKDIVRDNVMLKLKLKYAEKEIDAFEFLEEAAKAMPDFSK